MCFTIGHRWGDGNHTSVFIPSRHMKIALCHTPGMKDVWLMLKQRRKHSPFNMQLKPAVLCNPHHGYYSRTLAAILTITNGDVIVINRPRLGLNIGRLSVFARKRNNKYTISCLFIPYHFFNTLCFIQYVTCKYSWLCHDMVNTVTCLSGMVSEQA